MTEARADERFAERLAERLASFEDRRMWRLVLARLHPDAGGDPDLFAFACAIRQEVSGGRPGERLGEHPRERSRRPRWTTRTSRASGAGQTAFLRTWRDTMGNWSSQNRGGLKDFLNR